MTTPLLALVLLVVLANLIVCIAQWWRHDNLTSRVTKLEAHREASLSHTEVRGLYERLSSIEGQIQTTNRLMQTVQEHLLEND